MNTIQKHIIAVLLLVTTTFVPSTAGAGRRDRGALAFPQPVYDFSFTFSFAPNSGSDHSFHLPMIRNDRVDEYIDYFTTERTTFQAGLDNSMPYVNIMKEIFRQAHLPEELVYVAMIESWFDATAVSRANAVGPWQFMSGTARECGLRTDRWIDERRDIIKSTFAAARHFQRLHDRLQSWNLVLAAYNAGASRVREAVFSRGSRDFWDLEESGYLAEETKTFVPKFMAAAIIARNPAAYGFRLPLPKAVLFDVVEIVGSTDLRSLARDLGAGYDELRSLNPEIIGEFTPPGTYLLKVPAGTTGAIGANGISGKNLSAALDDEPGSQKLSSDSPRPGTGRGPSDDKPLARRSRMSVPGAKTGKQRKSRPDRRAVNQHEQEAEADMREESEV